MTAFSPFRFLPYAFFKKRPVHLTLFLTKRCNARCNFCFYVDNSAKNAGIAEISLDEIRGISKSLGNLLWLAFSGGEIFLRDDLVEMSEIFYKNNRPSIMLYPTNGLLTGKIRENVEIILKNCPKSSVVVKLSIDGIGERHDALRGVNGSFKKALDTYGALSPLLSKYPNFELGVNTVFCSENQDDMDQIIYFVKTLDKIKTHTVSLVRGDINDPALKKVDMEKYLRAARKLEGDVRCRTYRFRGARIKAAQDILQRKLIYKTAKENRAMLPCFAGRLNLVVTEGGDVYPCETFKGEFLMGNLRDFGGDLKELTRSEKAAKVLATVKDCYCTHECYMMTNILFKPRMYPALLKELL